MEHRSPRFKQITSTGILLLAAIIWGMCFVAQRSGMEHIGPFLFNGIREMLGAVALTIVLAVVWFIARIRRSNISREVTASPDSVSEEYGVIVEPGFQAQPEEDALSRQRTPQINSKYILIAGLLCGIALYFASNLQQIGMVYVTASKAAFITTLYIVLVPILGLLFKHKAHWNTWVSVGIAVFGLYLLCMGDTFSLELGDIALLASALFWAIHILAVGHYAPRLSLIQLFGMCSIQFAVAGVLSLATAPFVDHFFVSTSVSMAAIVFVAPELLYAGILSTAGGFTLAAIGQRYAKPTPAAIVMSTESVFGLLGGVLLLGEVLTVQEGIGCLLMLVAVVLTQLDFGRHKGTRKRGDPQKQPSATESSTG